MANTIVATSGTECIHLIGKVVTVDVETGQGRTVNTGIYHGAQDAYGENGNLEYTAFLVGTGTGAVDWDMVKSVRITVHN